MKWLLFALIMIGLIIWWRHTQIKKQVQPKKNPTQQGHHPSAGTTKHPSTTQAAQSPKAMIQCPYCQVRFEEGSGDGAYCSKAHRQAIDPKGWWGMAEHVSSPNFDARPEHMPVELVLIHHISLPPGQFGHGYIADFFQNRLDPNAHPYFKEIANREVSSHFLIYRDGRVQQFVSTEHRAWHAGVSDFFGRERCNDFSIGIELEGTDDLPFQPAQYASLKDLVSALSAKYPIAAYAGHSDVAPGRKTDPGIHFDWELFARMAGIPERQLPYGLTKR